MIKVGFKHSDESRAKMSMSRTGKILSTEHRLNISSGLKGKIPKNLEQLHLKSKGRISPMKGRTHSQETILKMSKSQRGRIHSPETRLKIGEASRNRSLETLIKLSNAARNISSETRLKRSLARKGKSHSLETRCKIGDANRGNKSHMWKGGISFDPYCPSFNFPFKERVRKFFGRICVECGKNETDNKRRLETHHVNSDKMTCCNDVKPLFVALCKSCHLKTQKNPDYWEKHYTEIINEKYNGKCYFTKEEAKNL